MTIPNPYYLLLSPSENFQLNEVLPDILPEVLPEIPPVVPLDVHLEVYLEVHFVDLTFSDHTWVIPTHPKSIWLV